MNKNREIKFRAWDKKKNKMWRPYENTTMTHGECVDGFDDDVLMQFTGLLDKNGKEIFEGDIFEAEEPTFESKVEKYVVEFQDGSFIGTDQQNKVEIHTLKEWADKEATIEVIGNIYQNPELLK